MTMRMLLLVVGLTLMGSAGAQARGALPEWDQLTPGQREALIAPLRERWNAHPNRRPAMLDHAERWQRMTPDERKRARQGMKRWRHLSDEERAHLRVLFAHMRTLPEDQARTLKAEFRAMTLEQRRAWVAANRDAVKATSGE